MKEPHQKEYQIEVSVQRLRERRKYLGQATDASRCNLPSQAVISVDFGPKILLKERLTSALRGSGIALPFWSIGHSADFTTLCPHPTAEQEAAWAARRFWQFATGESACKTYKLTICELIFLSCEYGASCPFCAKAPPRCCPRRASSTARRRSSWPSSPAVTSTSTRSG